MYSIFDYGSMIADAARTSAYAQALRGAVTEDSVVLDIGTGTGIFALLACQYGARRVYAVEPSSAIWVAQEIAAANGYANRIEFIQEHSLRMNLPEPVNVIVSDLSGTLPWFQQHIPSIIDARNRFLAPGGTLIPRTDDLWAALVEVPELYERIAGIWDRECYGLNMEPARRLALNSWRKARLTPDQLLGQPQCWAKLDYATVASPAVHAKVSWKARREGMAHGVGVWFDRVTVEGVDFSNAPGSRGQGSPVSYGHLFFPWFRPVALTRGDAVSVTLKADLVGEDYLWSWDTRVLDQSDPGRIKADFKQSSFFGAPLSPAQLRKRAARHVPALNESGQIDRFILESMDGCTPLAQLARSVAARFPSCFASWYDALPRVTGLSEKFSR